MGSSRVSTLKAHGVDLNGALTCINASSGRSMATRMVLPQRVFNRSFPTTFALDLLTKDTAIARWIWCIKPSYPRALLALTQSLYRAASHTTAPNSFFGIGATARNMEWCDLE